MENVLKKLKEVTWETLGARVSLGGSILQLPFSQQLKIEKYAGETEHKREGIKYWLWHNSYASWRWLITQLDWAEEHAAADQIHGYAEKLTGMLSSSLYYLLAVIVHMCMKSAFEIS